MPIKLFFAEFCFSQSEEVCIFLALYDGILLTQHPKNHCIENQSGAT